MLLKSCPGANAWKIGLRETLDLAVDREIRVVSKETPGGTVSKDTHYV